MADKRIDYNALGQALDTTWGRSSTPQTASYSVKFKMLGSDRLEASFAVVVNFGTERQMIDVKRAYADESQKLISQYVKHIKDRYKDLSGNSITISEETSSDSVEITGFAVFNPKRTAYYRRKTIFNIA